MCSFMLSELVKKRVEEYEKLQEESKRNEECGRVTRTKTRAMAKEDAKAKGLKTGNQQTSDSVKVYNSYCFCSTLIM